MAEIRIPEYSKLSQADKQDVGHLAQMIRTAFIRRKTHQMGKPFRPAQRHDNADIWLKAALRCFALQAGPEEFVEAAFALFTKTVPGGPYATHLTGDAIVKGFKTYYLQRTISNEDRSTLEELDKEYDPATADLRAVQERIKANLEYTMRYLFNCTGEKRINLVTLAYLKQPMTPADALTRVLLGGQDEMIMTEYYDEVSYHFRRVPKLKQAAEALGFAVSTIIRYGERLREAGMLKPYVHQQGGLPYA